MKIAYTINGIIGGLAGKNSEQNNPDLVSKLAEFSYKSIDKNILKNNDVDIFLFSCSYSLLNFITSLKPYHLE